MRRLAILTLGAFCVVVLSSCAPHDEATQTSIEAGGTVPWNRPEKWEGGGALGSQMSAMQGGGY